MAGELPSSYGQIKDIVFALNKRRKSAIAVTDEDVDFSASRCLL